MTTYKIAGIDIHKKVLIVVVADAGAEQLEFVGRRFGATTSEREKLVAWLREQGVEEVVMESTAQYWKPVWLDLEPQISRLHLAQAQSNRARKGRKHDFADARRLVRRFLSGELILSFVPGAEQRAWRMLTRGKVQLVCDRVRLQNQMEALLEEMRIKLSSVISELLGLSGRRILAALAQGESDPEKLAELGDIRLRCSKQELADALNGRVEPLHRRMLRWFLQRLELLDRQIEEIDQAIAEAMQPHADAVMRLAEVPGFGPDSAQQLIAEVGPEANTFPSAGELSSWIGVCPGSEESAEHNHSTRSPKGNTHARRILVQAAHAAVKTKGSHYQRVFRRLLPQLAYQGAVWAVAHKLCRVAWKILHDRVRYVEQGEAPTPKRRRDRIRKMLRELRRMGYAVTPPTPAPQSSG